MQRRKQGDRYLQVLSGQTDAVETGPVMHEDFKRREE